MGINNKQFLLNQIIWIGISLGISIAISIILPFPVSLVVIIGVFILLSMYMRKIVVNRMGAGKGLGIQEEFVNMKELTCVYVVRSRLLA